MRVASVLLVAAAVHGTGRPVSGADGTRVPLGEGGRPLCLFFER